MTVQSPPVSPASVSAPPRPRRVPPAIWLIGPSIVFMTLLLGWPLIQGVLQAFQNEQGFTLQYVNRMVEDPYFWPAVRNTVLLIAVMIPLQFGIAIAMALLLRSNPRLNKLHFFVWAIPLALSDLAAGLVWLSIFNDRGYLNSFLQGIGIEGISWLAYDNQATLFLCVLIAEVWRSTSLVLVIVVSGMQGIPKDYDEAAQVFGATFWQRLRHVTLPLLKPSLQVALILRTILAFQTFAVAQALTGQNFPLVVGETYRWYTALQNPNVAAALALVILVASMLTSIFYLRALREKGQGGTR
ncbi:MULTISPECIES: sugar ABC transporter permease [unclassified Arthrobacter]|uniref:carbohydrate ABC transporter permease n=1 Tax=unclassified Arthrobacter TaxID=235627 RepID=UPI001CFF5981|nr:MULTISPECIES: sugar ABC transporter permease [unclassified Arthrobacter]MCB5280763.1 Lactose transport system permease protein LacF [Arthrobacter sp. ES1]WGZ79465.1 sugar ABC transporter permease [Arthrobacter sp. EM1]